IISDKQYRKEISRMASSTGALSSPAYERMGGLKQGISIALVFLLLYNLSFIAAPSLVTTRIAVLLLFLCFAKSNMVLIMREVNADFNLYVLIFGVFAYAMV